MTTANVDDKEIQTDDAGRQYAITDETPTAYAVGMDNEGVLVIAFTEPVEPISENEINATEVAIKRKRTLQGDRVETLLTEEGYQEFDIKPALEFSVVDSNSK